MIAKTTPSALRRAVGHVCAGAGLFAVLLATPAVADELANVTKLLRAGKAGEALARTNQFLASHPSDPQMRFMKGVLLTEQNKSDEAIAIFTRLTEDYKDLPEPYNNLAVLYAASGQYDKARVALEKAIRTNPSYMTAYENLGDVYGKLASQAYDKALALGTTTPPPPSKLTLLRTFSSSTGGKSTAGGDNQALASAAAAPAASVKLVSPIPEQPKTVPMQRIPSMAVAPQAAPVSAPSPVLAKATPPSSPASSTAPSPLAPARTVPASAVIAAPKPVPVPAPVAIAAAKPATAPVPAAPVLAAAPAPKPVPALPVTAAAVSAKPAPALAVATAAAAPAPVKPAVASAPAPVPVASATPAKPAPAPVPASATTPAIAAAAKPGLAPAAGAASLAAPVKAAAPAIAAAAATVPPPAKAEAAKPAAGNAERDEVLGRVGGWAKAWAAQDVDGYLGYYNNGFIPPKGLSRQAWAEERRARIVGKGRIRVEVNAPQVVITGDTAKVTFRQVYESDRLSANSRKTLIMVKHGGKWQIKQESSGS